jgi:pimeloyl-ACP methyl ester carboxylesterase
MADLVLVPGAFVGGWYWHELARHLEKDGHRAHVVEEKPSAGAATPPGSVISAPTPRTCGGTSRPVGEPVALVGHSYGGMVITEPADHPAVAHTGYVTAFWPRRGQSLLDLLGDAGLPDWMVCTPTARPPSPATSSSRAGPSAPTSTSSRPRWSCAA